MLTPDEEAEARELVCAIERKLSGWDFLARANQRPPQGDWFVWLILAGRGWGKTRTGAEYIKAALMANPGWHAALVAETIADARDTMMEGEESGLLKLFDPADLRGGSVETAWNRSLGELYLANGSKAKTYSAEKPGLLRGPQHHVAWCDEAAKWKDAPRGTEEDTTWSNLMFGLRLGHDPRCVVTTTPRPFKLIRELVAADSTAVTKGATYENLGNLAPAFASEVITKYEGTRLGRQELLAELLDDVPGAAWSRADIDKHRVRQAPILRRIVVGVDPSVTSKSTSAECGIVVAGIGTDGHGYVLADDSRRDTPKAWATQAVTAYHAHDAADSTQVEQSFHAMANTDSTPSRTGRSVATRSSRQSDGVFAIRSTFGGVSGASCASSLLSARVGRIDARACRAARRPLTGRR